MKQLEREEFERKLMEQRIFDELKNCSFPGVSYIRRKWQGLNLDYSGIHRRIVNYQIKTYGSELQTYSNKRTKEAIEQSNQRARCRRYYRRNAE